jgi:hypothetical protein
LRVGWRFVDRNGMGRGSLKRGAGEEGRITCFLLLDEIIWRFLPIPSFQFHIPYATSSKSPIFEVQRGRERKPEKKGKENARSPKGLYRNGYALPHRILLRQIRLVEMKVLLVQSAIERIQNVIVKGRDVDAEDAVLVG